MDHLFLLKEALRAINSEDLSRANALWRRVISLKPGEPSLPWCEDVCQEYFNKTCESMREYIFTVKDVKKIELPLPDWLTDISDLPYKVPTIKLFSQHVHKLMLDNVTYSEITNQRKSKRPKTFNFGSQSLDTLTINLLNMDFTFLQCKILDLPLFRKETKIYKIEHVWYQKLPFNFIFISNKLKDKVFHSNF